MTKILMSSDRQNNYFFLCLGHTGYGEYGKDILCASVSTLCFALLRFLEGAKERGEIEKLISHIEDGRFILSFACINPNIIYGFKSILCGFENLYESYGDYISFTKMM